MSPHERVDEADLGDHRDDVADLLAGLNVAVGVDDLGALVQVQRSYRGSPGSKITGAAFTSQTGDTGLKPSVFWITSHECSSRSGRQAGAGIDDGHITSPVRP